MACIDFGDVELCVTWRVKGKRKRLVWHVGAAYGTTPEDRARQGNTPITPSSGRTDLIMDLAADMGVSLSIAWTDEVGNPTTAPVDAVVTYSVDDPSIISLTDNGDGTARANATGVLGTANVHVDATGAGLSLSGDLQLVVVPGLAERITIVADEPTEVTPDA